MMKSKLWYSKTVNKIVKSAKMMKVIETYDYYSLKLNFGHLFTFVRVSSTWVVMIRISGRVLPGRLSRND